MSGLPENIVTSVPGWSVCGLEPGRWQWPWKHRDPTPRVVKVLRDAAPIEESEHSPKSKGPFGI